jgi:hypothetical protein
LSSFVTAPLELKSIDFLKTTLERMAFACNKIL